MAKHHPDLIMCRKQPGIAIGRLCEKCDGRCVVCDSYVRPCTLVRICDGMCHCVRSKYHHTMNSQVDSLTFTQNAITDRIRDDV